jgi:hypothetical protein
MPGREESRLEERPSAQSVSHQLRNLLGAFGNYQFPCRHRQLRFAPSSVDSDRPALARAADIDVGVSARRRCRAEPPRGGCKAALDRSGPTRILDLIAPYDDVEELKTTYRQAFESTSRAAQRVTVV